jgi:hydrogenase maturation protein HypF
VGGHLKNTIALAWEQRVVISPHIGDLDSSRSLDIFVQVVTDLQKLYQVQAHTVVCDAHPHYASTRWAKRSVLPVIPVFHHHAHASALAGEFLCQDPWLVFTWDGVGLGTDGTLWGGEALYGKPGQWQRVASFRPFYLPGGDKAGREPWRSAVALCWETQTPWVALKTDTTLLYQAWQRRVNCPPTTAVGRLFDAAAALTGVLHTASFEGQGPMWLEAICNESEAWIELPIQRDSGGRWQTDWAPLVSYLLNEKFSINERAAVFHNSLAYALLAQVRQLSKESFIGQVGLSGGVFQNRRLTETVVRLLREEGIRVCLAERLPGNDAGIGFGQIVEVMGLELLTG